MHLRPAERLGVEAIRYHFKVISFARRAKAYGQQARTYRSGTVQSAIWVLQGHTKNMACQLGRGAQMGRLKHPRECTSNGTQISEPSLEPVAQAYGLELGATIHALEEL